MRVISSVPLIRAARARQQLDAQLAAGSLARVLSDSTVSSDAAAVALSEIRIERAPAAAAPTAPSRAMP